MIITQNASSAQCFQSDATKNFPSTQDLVAQELAKIEFISPTGFGYWEATKGKDVVGLVDMDFSGGKHDGKWKSAVFGWGSAYHDSYRDAEDTFWREYARFLSSKINNN
jgi:hypothetical protein